MNKQVKILYDRTLTFDGISYKTKITKPTKDSNFNYQIKTSVKINGKTFVDYRNHAEFGVACWDDNALDNQLDYLLRRLCKNFPQYTKQHFAWYHAIIYYIPQTDYSDLKPLSYDK